MRLLLLAAALVLALPASATFTQRFGDEVALGDAGEVAPGTSDPVLLALACDVGGDVFGACTYAGDTAVDVSIADAGGQPVPEYYEFVRGDPFASVAPVTLASGHFCHGTATLVGPAGTEGLIVEAGGAASAALRCPGDGVATSGVITISSRTSAPARGSAGCAAPGRPACGRAGHPR